MNFFEQVANDMPVASVAPVFFAVSTLLNARRRVIRDADAFAVLNRALWSIVYSLTGEVLESALFLVRLDHFRSNARLLQVA